MEVIDACVGISNVALFLCDASTETNDHVKDLIKVSTRQEAIDVPVVETKKVQMSVSDASVQVDAVVDCSCSWGYD